jgi:hypothetical protein
MRMLVHLIYKGGGNCFAEKMGEAEMRTRSSMFGLYKQTLFLQNIFWSPIAPLIIDHSSP